MYPIDTGYVLDLMTQHCTGLTPNMFTESQGLDIARAGEEERKGSL
jgi:hypothetical protein